MISEDRNAVSADRLLEEIVAVVGQGHVLTSAHDMAPMLTDWRGRYNGKAMAVVMPATTHDVSAVVKLCAEAGVCIVPQGGNTGMCAAATPMTGSRPAIVLRLDRMNRIRSVSPLGDSISVDAGCILSNVHGAAAERDRLFPLSLGAEGSCQIGGNMATNAGGTAALRYGTMRDLVMGLEVVLADGRVLDLMTGLRKDSAGYDLRQLFIGSEGTLGIITGAVLKLFPRPAERAVAMVKLNSIQDVLTLLSLARKHFNDSISAFELLNLEQIRVISEYRPEVTIPFALDSAHYVLIELNESHATGTLSERIEQFLEQALEMDILADAMPAQNEAQAAAFWKIRHSVSEASKAAGHVVSHDSVVPLSAQGMFIEEVEKAIHAVRPDARIVMHGHVGDGNIHVLAIIRPVADAAERERQVGVINDAVDAVTTRLGGSISAEHGIGHVNIDRLARAAPPLELELMRATKRMLDPQNLLNPGKIFR